MSWTAPEFLASLQTALQANTTLLGLSPRPKVFTCWTGPSTDVSDAVMLYAVRGSQDPATLQGSGPRYDDTYQVLGEIRVIRPLERGRDEEAVNADARDRANAILDVVITEADQRPPAGSQILRSHVNNIELDQVPALAGGNVPAGSRIVLIGFTVQVRVRTTPA
jgi:hypothetical protein